MNPNGWPIGTIRDLVAEAKYGTAGKANLTEGKYPVLRMNNLTYSGDMDFTNLKYMDLKSNELDKYLVRDGDILFNRTNSKELVGKTAIYKGTEKMAYAGYLVRIRVNEKATPEFISMFLNSMYGKATLMNMSKSIVGMANINAQEVQDIRIYLPPVKLQRLFADKLESIRRLKSKIAKSNIKTQELFAAIQQRAFVGEI